MFQNARRAQDKAAVVDIAAKAGLSIGNDVLSFLSGNALEPTPLNYELGYLYLLHPKSLTSRAIDAILMEGDVLTQEAVDKIITTHLHPAAADEGTERKAMQSQALMLSEIASAALATTGQFGRDLDDKLPALAEGVDIVGLVAQMISDSKSAERALGDAARQIDALRQEVDAAKNDAACDALTGLPNRRGLNEALRKLPVGKSAAVAICDVDHFKKVNDRYGHVVGDRVLKLVASSLTESCEPHLVARWGGEEFILVFNGLSVAEAAAVVNRARDDLGKRVVRLRDTDEPMGTITFSAGVAPLVARKLDEAVAVSDDLLYRAKANGRNRVET